MSVVVNCPHCGRRKSVKDSVRTGTQVETCHRCNKLFGVRFVQGELDDVTK